MVHQVKALQPFSAHTHIHQEKGGRSTLDRVKNALTGRVFSNWREQLLGGATAIYVIKAALSFFGASFLTSIFQFSMAAFMAVLRKEIADFTNLHEATKSYREQNMKFALSNIDMRNSVREFKAEIRSLRKEALRFEASNEEYAYNNQMHSQLLGNLETTTDELATELREAMDSGNAVSGRILQGFLEGVERVKEQKQLLTGVQRELQSEHVEHLDQLEKVLAQVTQAGDHHIHAITEANAELTRNRTELEKIRADLATYKGQAKALQAEITNLGEIRKGLQEDVAKLRQAREEIDSAVGSLGEAAKHNVATANMVAGTFKSLFFATDENGKDFLSSERAFGSLLLIGTVAQIGYRLLVD